jgi:hypothetical protein
MAERRITPVHYEVLIKIFELDGFSIGRKKGDHIIHNNDKTRSKETSCDKDEPEAGSCYSYPH